MTHPPIPPGCEWFFVQDAKETWGFNPGNWWSLDEIGRLGDGPRGEKFWRRAAAGVARAALEDEIARLVLEWRAGDEDMMAGYCRMQRHVTEWKKWGEQ